MIKFGKSLTEHERRLIEFERKRTILYLSMLNKQPVWINIWYEKQNMVISGVVKSIINGTVKKNKHLLLGGRFSLDGDNYFSIDHIYAVGFRPFSLEDKDFENDWANSFNSSIFGDEAESKSDILFSCTDLKPQDFNENTPLDREALFTGEFRSFNIRYYEIIAKIFKS